MDVRTELSLRDHAVHRHAFEYGAILIDEIDDFGLAHEEAAVDHAAVARTLFAEALHGAAIVRQAQRAVAPRLRHGGERAHRLGRTVPRDQRGNVHVADAVAISEAEGAIEQVAGAAQAAAGHGVEPGVQDGDLPVLGIAIEPFDRAGPEIDGKVAGPRHVVEEIGADILDLIPAKDHELAKAVMGIDLHDVPQQRTPADFHHRLRRD